MKVTSRSFWWSLVLLAVWGWPWNTVCGAWRSLQTGTYLASMINRSGDAVDELLDITDRESIPEIQEILDVFDGVELKANDATALLAAADEIGEATRRFVASHDGTQLASLDPLYLGFPFWPPDQEP